MLNIGEYVKQLDLSYIDDEDVKWYNHFASLEVSYKCKHILLI